MIHPDKKYEQAKVAAALPAFPEDDLPAILDSIQEILRSGRLILGKYTHEFESSFRDYIGTSHAVAVNSGTSALQITLRFLGASKREVIMPVNNFPGVVTAALSEGAHPVLADIDPESFCIDVDDAIRRVTPSTAGMVIVHIAGLICPKMDQLRSFCQDRGLFLIEDAAHAHGAEHAGQKAGSLGDAACFSFYPTKIMTTGTGGMITSSNADLANYARSVRHHGQGEDRSLFVRAGNDWCMGEIQAVLGLQQLRRLNEHVAHRNAVVKRYALGLKKEDWLSIPEYPAHIRHAYYKFPVLLDDTLDAREFRRLLGEEYQVENGTLYDPPCHRQPVFGDLPGVDMNSFPNSDAALSRQLCPPVHSTLSFEEVDRVIDAMKSVAERLAPA